MEDDGLGGRLSIVANAALDYTMSVNDVEKIYNEYWYNDTFYHQLELFIKLREESDNATNKRF